MPPQSNQSTQPPRQARYSLEAKLTLVRSTPIQRRRRRSRGKVSLASVMSLLSSLLQFAASLLQVFKP